MTGPIYTRSGDQGETSLVGGSRTPKDSPRIKAYGTLDEANSHIGLARAKITDPLLDDALGFVQQRLFNCSSRLATPEDAISDATPGVGPEDVQALERMIDVMTDRMGDVEHFLIPGGSETAAHLHIARAVVRRGERAIVALGRTETIDADVKAFINRLSDLLFTAARYANHVAGSPDSHWDPDAGAPDT